MKNKVFIIFFCCCILLNLTGVTHALADHNSLFSRATLITTNSPLMATFAEGYDIDCFKFKALEDGYYLFYSQGNSDSQGYLYGSDQVFIKKSDNDGEKENFSIIHHMKKGEFVYLKVDNKYRVAGSYSLIVRQCAFTGIVSDTSRIRAPLRFDTSMNPTYADIWIPLHVYENGQPSPTLSANMVVSQVSLADGTPLRYAVQGQAVRIIIDRVVNSELVIRGLTQEALHIPIQTYVEEIEENVIPPIVFPPDDNSSPVEVWIPYENRALEDIVIKPISAKALPGNIVAIPVDVSSKSGISAGSMSIAYNNQLLTPIDIAYGEIINASELLMADVNLTYRANEIHISWASSEPIFEAGTLFTIQFEINSEAIAAEVPITLTNIQLNGYTGGRLDYKVAPGQVIIENYILGDCTLDGRVDLVDVTLIVQYQTDKIVLTPKQLIAADVTGDKIVDVADALQILRYVSGSLK